MSSFRDPLKYNMKFCYEVLTKCCNFVDNPSLDDHKRKRGGGRDKTIWEIYIYKCFCFRIPLSGMKPNIA